MLSFSGCVVSFAYIRKTVCAFLDVFPMAFNAFQRFDFTFSKVESQSTCR